MKSNLAGFTDDANSKQDENVDMQQHSYKNDEDVGEYFTTYIHN